MKKILPVVIVIGVVSLVACAGLGSCETTVYADESNFRLEGHKAQAVTGSGDYPYQIGLYDVVDYDNYTVTYQTWRVNLASSEGWTIVNYNNGWYRFDYGLSKSGTSTNVDFVLRGLFDDYPKNVGGYSKSVIVNSSLSIKTNEYSSLAALGSALLLNPITLVYKTATPISTSNPYNAAGVDPYQWGYVEGYNYAVETLFDMKMGVYIQWNTGSNSNRTFTVEWSTGGSVIGSQTLSYYNSTVYFERPMASTYDFSITASNGVPFSVTYSSVNYPDEFQTVTSDLAYQGVYYLPTWEGSITLTVNPDDIVTGWPSDYDFSLDSSQYLHVNLSSTFAAGYRQGVLDGYADGYANGADDVRSLAYSMGRDDGYADGYDYGYRVGYNEGENAVSEGGLVVANLFGAVAGVPISILNGLSGLTIWSIPLISVLMSFMFLGIIIWVVKKFI